MAIVNFYGQQLNEYEQIELNKYYSSIRKKVLSEISYEKCSICEKEHPKFCSSHAIPQFILKQISKQGCLYNILSLTENTLFNNENGINNTQTFKSICVECDSKIFKDYENPINYFRIPTNKMLNQIALKNYLYYHYKLTRDIKIHEYLNRDACEIYDKKKGKGPLADIIKKYIYDRDLYQKKENFLIPKLQSNEDVYTIGYYVELDYTIPIVAQTMIGIYEDFVGRKINDNLSKRDLVHFHLCCFPFKDKSIIFIFYPKNEHKCDNFFRDLNTKTREEQLSVINFLLFAYTDDIFISKEIDLSKIKQNLGLVACTLPVSKTEGELTTKQRNIQLKKDFKETYALKNHIKYINLLSEEYKL